MTSTIKKIALTIAILSTTACGAKAEVAKVEIKEVAVVDAVSATSVSLSLPNSVEATVSSAGAMR